MIPIGRGRGGYAGTIASNNLIVNTPKMVRKLKMSNALSVKGFGPFPATAGSVLRPSTSAEIANVFPRLKDRRKRSLLHGGKPAVDLLDLLLDPSHAADFDLAILPDQEQSGYIRQAVSIRDGVAVGIVEQHAEGNSVLFKKSCGIA